MKIIFKAAGAVLGVFLFFIGISLAANTDISISGNVHDPNHNIISGATVQVIGTTISTTSASDGSYSLNVPQGSVFILKTSASNYLSSYSDIENADTNLSGQNITIVSTTFANQIYSSAGVTRQNGDATIAVNTQDQYGNDIYGASAVIKDMNGNTPSGITIIYLDSNANVYNSPNSSTNTYLILNIPVGFYMISASKSGTNFGFEPIETFANSITQCNHFYSAVGLLTFQGFLLNDSNSPVSGANVQFIGTPFDSTTNPTGIFYFSNVSYPTTMIFKASQSGYQNTYQPDDINNSNQSSSGFFIVSTQEFNKVAGQMGIIPDITKGSFTGNIVDGYNNGIKNAVVTLYNEDGTQNTAYKVYYFSDNGNVDTSLTQTSSSGDFIIPNIPVNPDLYFRYTIGSTYTSPVCPPIMVFPNSITIYPNMPGNIQKGNLSISGGQYNPSSQTVPSGTTKVPMLQIKLHETTNYEAITLNNIKITNSGTGNISNVSNVYLYNDVNDNGIVDSSDVLLGSGTFSSNGTITFNPNITIPAGGIINLLVACDFNLSATGTYQESVENSSDINATGVISNFAISNYGPPVNGGIMTIQQSGQHISVSPTSFDFGTITVGQQSSAETIIITNNGTQNINIGTITNSNTTDFQIISDNASSETITAGQSKNISIIFKPQSMGSKSANISIPSNAQEGTQTVALTGYGYISPTLTVSPSTGLASTGAPGGPFSPYNTTYSVSNSGGGTLTWSVSADQNWVTVSPASGTNSGTVTVSINSNANSLTAGLYTSTVTFTSNGGTSTRNISLTISVPPTLAVSPSIGLSSIGLSGGPFNPFSTTYSVSNSGSGTVNWTVSADQTWVTVSPTSGTNSGIVTVSINSGANSLTTGSYTSTVTFTSNGGTITRNVSLTVSTPPVFNNIKIYDINGNQLTGNGNVPVDYLIKFTGTYTAGSDGANEETTIWTINDTTGIDPQIYITNSGTSSYIWIPRNLLSVGRIYSITAQVEDSSGLWATPSSINFTTVPQSSIDTIINSNTGTQGPSDQVPTDTNIKQYFSDGVLPDTAAMINFNNMPVLVETSTGDTIIYLGQFTPGTPPPAGSAFDGVFTTKIECTPGATITVTYIFPQNLPAGTKWYKYIETNPVGQQWVEYPNAVIIGNTVIVQLTDGGQGDQDGIANGIILDPSGPVQQSSSPVSTGGGSSGGIPVNPLAIGLITILVLLKRIKNI